MLQSILILDPPDHSVDDLARELAALVPADCSVECLFTAQELLDRLRGGTNNQLAIVHSERGDGVREGLGLITELRSIAPTTPVVAVADHGDVDSAAQAIDAGANDFLVRGPQLRERAATVLGKLRVFFQALDRAEVLDERNTDLQRTIQARYRMIGESPEILAVIERLKKLAEIPRHVLIVGERGTGKELVARALHEMSSDTERPLVTVNCAAFSDTLLESELFGHRKGAFTGAEETRAGKFEQADGGTLFLDEIGHMSLPFQQKILRVVEYGRFTRVGGHEEREVDLRIVSATNADLQTKIRQKNFLGDLYDRLAFEVLEVPPLRTREGDVEVLAQHFLDEFALEIPAFRGKRLAKSALKVLRKYPFPGNVRELKNIIERAAYRDTTNEITPEDIGMLAEAQMISHHGTYEERVEAFSRQLIQQALEASGGNQAQAARSLGLSYHQFRYFRRKYLPPEVD